MKASNGEFPLDTTLSSGSCNMTATVLCKIAIWYTGLDEFTLNQSVKRHMQRPLEGQVLKVISGTWNWSSNDYTNNNYY